jgi:hypothetical protein
MKMFMCLLALLALIPITSFALPRPADAEKLMNLGSVRGPGVQLGYQVISNKVQLLKCKYDFAVNGGSSAAAIKLRAVDGSKCLLPDNAVVVNTLIDVLTAPTSAGSATIAVGTGQAANDIKTATAIASFTGIMAGIPVAAASAVKMTADRQPTMSIAVAPITKGKFNVFISYLLSE